MRQILHSGNLVGRSPIDASVSQIINLLERRLKNPGKQSETIYINPHVVRRDTH